MPIDPPVTAPPDTAVNDRPLWYIEYMRRLLTEKKILYYGFAFTFLSLVVAILALIGDAQRNQTEGQLEIRATYAGTLSDAMKITGDSPLKLVWKSENGNISTINTCSIVSYSIKNVGRKAFVWNDRVTSPLTFAVKGGASILGLGPPYQEQRSEKMTIQSQLLNDQTKLTIATDYINPGEELKFAIYHTDPDPKNIDLDYRIKDQPKINYWHAPSTKASPNSRTTILYLIWGQCLVSIAVQCSFFATAYKQTKDKPELMGRKSIVLFYSLVAAQFIGPPAAILGIPSWASSFTQATMALCIQMIMVTLAAFSCFATILYTILSSTRTALDNTSHQIRESYETARLTAQVRQQTDAIVQALEKNEALVQALENRDSQP